MKKAILCLSGSQTKRWIHEQIKNKLAFPDYYGCNLDALYECLTEIAEDTVVALCVREAGDDADEYDATYENDAFECAEERENEDNCGDAYIERLLRVFADAEEENDSLHVIRMATRGSFPTELML